jgi:hypothetical protein
MVITVQNLADLCGYEFDEDEERRGGAIIQTLTIAAEGIIGGPIDVANPHPAVISAISSASLRMMQNKAGVIGETIGGFTAQYPNAGSLFTVEERTMLRSARSAAVGTIVIRTPVVNSFIEE